LSGDLSAGDFVRVFQQVIHLRGGMIAYCSVG
jgi:hypothetical protein